MDTYLRIQGSYEFEMRVTEMTLNPLILPARVIRVRAFPGRICIT